MLTEEKNRLLTQVGPSTAMGNLLRRYWMPIAGVSEFDDRSTKPIRLMGEDLVLYKDLSGTFGLVDRHCPHRRADLAHGMVESSGLRCSYHGWRFDETGQCVEQPYEDTAFPERKARQRVTVTAYPVQVKGGMLWTYMGPQPAPLLPDWEAFSWDNGFSQVVITEVPCNWFQCQENSIDPVHFEWMHENWGRRLRTGDMSLGPAHLKLEFDEFDYGFVYRRTREDSDEKDDAWTVGRVCLWPNGFFLGEHFEWRVPIDDENTLSVTWKYTRVPKGREPYVQQSVPTWYGPLTDARGRWIDTHVMNQDFVAWVGQGVIADRTKEHLGASDRGVVAIRRRFFDELERVAAGGEAKGTIRDPAKNVRVRLPMMDRAQVLDGFTVDEIMKHPRMKLFYTTYIFQAGQPENVRQAFSDAMGLEVREFDGIVGSKRNA
jgi:5,5'-dehydrodivanillate O-demethylase